MVHRPSSKLATALKDWPTEVSRTTELRVEMQKKQKIVVAGASGFIGRSLLADLCALPYDIVALTRQSIGDENSNIRWCQIPSYTENEAFSQACIGADALIMLADNPARTGYEEAANEVDTSWIQAALDQGVSKVVFASSIYARLAEGGAQSDYGQHKLLIEKDLAAAVGLPNVILRLPPVYGPRSKGGFSFLVKLVKKMPVLPFGNANAPRDYLFVSNLTSLLIRLLELTNEDFSRISGTIYEPCDGQSTSTAELVKLMREAQQRTCFNVPFPQSAIRLAGRLLGAEQAIAGALDTLVAKQSPSLDEDIGWTAQTQLPETLAFLRD
ncbi:MAG: NAD-dependent epimerase/dehydratase family protein [Marinomonas sp.]